MWLLNQMLKRLIRRGELVVTNYDGQEYRYGRPEPGWHPIRMRLTDRGAARSIASDPRVGAGEAYMNGRLTFDEGDIRDLAMLARFNAPWERSGALKPHGLLRRFARATAARLDQINWRSRSQRNAEHAYNLTRRLYEIFLDEDRQYTCAYYRDWDNSLEQAQLDKKAHIAAKLDLRPGMR